MLEELGLAYVREDYGRQFNNTNTDEYRKLNPTIKVPTLIDGEVVIWESNSILRYLAAKHKPTLTGATPADKTYVERWMDWQLGALNTPYVAVFKDARKPAAERSADFAAQSADLIAQMKILDGHIAGKSWFALDRLTIADICLAPIVKRCLEFPIEKPAFRRTVALAEVDRCAAGIRRRDRHETERSGFGGVAGAADHSRGASPPGVAGSAAF